MAVSLAFNSESFNFMADKAKFLEVDKILDQIIMMSFNDKKDNDE
jgi:hypothetical protein